MKKASSVSEYLAGQPPKTRAALQRLRRVIKDTLPNDAEEIISYGMPAYKVGSGRALLYFAGFKNHCSLFPGSTTPVRKFAKELAGFKTTPGTIQFTLDRPLPDALVRKIVRARLAEKKTS